jgi:hypothetical protein
VDGLIGADFFREHVVQIDFAARKLRFLADERLEAAGETLPLRSRRGAILVPLRVGGDEAQWARLDTGCACDLRWVNTAGHLEAVIGQEKAVALTEGSFPVARTRVRLGTIEFDSVPTALHPRRIFSGEAGLLGNGLLSRFKSVTVDVKQGRLFLEPQASSD